MKGVDAEEFSFGGFDNPLTDDYVMLGLLGDLELEDVFEGEPIKTMSILVGEFFPVCNFRIDY